METEKPRIVMLVDNKRRDLLVAALIAHHIRRLGGEPFLEPLEAYRAAIPAHRPHLILFNHLLASHLADYSGKLYEMGVKVAVLPNEALLYNPESLRYTSRRHTAKAHIDLYFAWNQPLHDMLREVGFKSAATQIEIVGNPRFDFYFEPWRRVFQQPRTERPRPRILICTNFVFAASINNRPAIERRFQNIKTHIKVYEDAWGAVESHHRSQLKVRTFIEALLKTGKYDVLLRPHPSEIASAYTGWIETLPADLRSRLKFQSEGSIFSLIMDCDLEISCETCTTALESWIAGKPNIEIVFEKHPLLYRAEARHKNPEVTTPEELIDEVERQLASPRQDAYRPARLAHLAKWVDSPNGRACEKIAHCLVETASKARLSIGPHLSVSDHRRGLKLRALRKLGLPVNYDPLLSTKLRIAPDRYKAKQFNYGKTIKPGDVEEAEQLLASLLK